MFSPLTASKGICPLKAKTRRRVEETTGFQFQKRGKAERDENLGSKVKAGTKRKRAGEEGKRSTREESGDTKGRADRRKKRLSGRAG